MITLNRKVRFSHSDFTYSGTSYTEYLLGSIGLKVNANIIVEVAWSTELKNLKFILGSNTIERLDTGECSFISDGFRIGDTIVVTGTASNNGTYTILEVTDAFIYITGVFPASEIVIANVFGETPIVAMDFYPNLIENSIDFTLFNLTDRETEPHYYADTISTSAGSPTTMIVGTNSHGWVSPADTATVYRLSFTNHIQTFVISHTFTILPLFLADQLENVQNGIPPAAGSFRDRLCLKYVYTIDGKFIALDPDIPHTTDGNVEFPKGQTGWYNEFLNGRPTVYTKNSIFYTEALTGKALTGIEYCKQTDVVAKFNSQGTFILAGNTCIGPPPVNGLPCNTPAEALNCTTFAGACTPNIPTKVILHVLYLPLVEDRYVNTATDYKTNFIYERAVVTIGSVAQGENTGDYHFLKNVSLTVQNINEATLNFEVDFSSVLEEYFDTLDDTNRNYLIFVTLQNPAATTITGIDQTALILDVNEYKCDKDDPTLFQIIDQEFFMYPDCAGCGYSDFKLLPMDTVLMKSQFYVQRGTELDPIIMQNISANIIAVRQNDVEEFPLESFTINTAGFLPNCENIQEIAFNQERDFILPAGDCRNEIRLLRMPTLDYGNKLAAYELIYPFKVRWEEWRKLQGASRCFPTPTQNWMIYGNEGGWSIKFSLKAQVYDTVTDHITDFEHITWGTIKDPCDIPYAVEFNTFDPTGINSYEEVIAKDTDTYVVATISGDFTGYTASQLYGILTLDAYGVGGVAYSQEIGTVIQVDQNFVWYGAGVSRVATLTKVNNSTMTLSAYLDYTNLPTDTNQFTLSARIGLLSECGSSSGSECFNETTIFNFTCGELEIIEVPDANTLIVSGEIVTDEERSVFADELELVFLTSTTWRLMGGTIDGQIVKFGTVGGNIIVAPAHPYSDANVGDTIQGAVTGIAGTVLFESDDCPSACYLLLETGAPVALEGGGYVLLEECT